MFPAPSHCLVEARVSENFPLLGKSICEGRIRTLYQAAIIAVARNGRRVPGRFGDIVPRPGYTLLMVTHPNFLERYRNTRDFLLISRLDDSTPARHERAGLALAIMTGMVATVAMGWLGLLEASMLAAGFMLLGRCTSASAARRAVDLQVLLVIAAAFGISLALQKSGAAGMLADSLIGMAGDDPWLTLALVFLVTSLFTNVITNKAAAALMSPIAVAAASRLDVSLLPFAIVIIKAASASFATPIGYQTNLKVMGPSGYRFTDYLRIGVPLTLLTCLLTVLIVPWIWPL